MPEGPEGPAELDWFRSHALEFADVGCASIAYRAIGDGPPLLCLHGWPFSSLTYRRIARRLSAHHRCYFVDLPGTGETVWSDATPFHFADQARTMTAFARAVGLDEYAILAHDTGATLARLIALIEPRVKRMVLLNTEIPGWRPPWIPLYGRVLGLPGANGALRSLLRSETFVRSAAGFGGCFADTTLLDAEFRACFVDPVIASARRREGLIRYLRGFDWGLVDALKTRHREIRAPVLLVWGAEDETFPVEGAEEIERQLADCRGLVRIAPARLLVHEEQPDAVANAILGDR